MFSLTSVFCYLFFVRKLFLDGYLAEFIVNTLVQLFIEFCNY